MKSAPTTRDQLERALLLLRRSLAYWGRALLVFIVGVACAVPYVFTRPRVFRSDTVILYHETIRSADLTGGEAASDNTARRVGARLREVLMARSSLEPIITDLGLYTKPGKPLDRRDLIDAVDEMRKHITFRAREGDTFEISFQGGTADEVQEVTRRLGDCIVQEAASRRSENAKALKEFLVKESEQNNADLRLKEAELAKFVALHPVLAARLQGQPAAPVVATTSSNPGDPVLSSLEARAARIDRQLKTAAGVPPPPPKPIPQFVPPADNPELLAARRDLAEKQARFTDKHPDVAAARTRLRTAEAAQAAANATALEAHNAAVAAANAAVHDDPPPKNAADEAALRQQYNELLNQIAARRAGLAPPKPPATADAGAVSGGATDPVPLGGDVGLEVEFRRVQREVAEGRERQRQLDEKLFKAQITASSVMSDRNIQVTVLDPAYLPTGPISRSRTSTLATLLLVCMVLAFGIALLSARIDDRIYDAIDLEQLASLPVLGVIPRAPQLPPKR